MTTIMPMKLEINANMLNVYLMDVKSFWALFCIIVCKWLDLNLFQRESVIVHLAFKWIL